MTGVTRSERALQSLCVWEQGIVRTPHEATYLLDQGCAAAGELPSALLQKFLEGVIAIGRGAFDQVAFQRGRVVLQTRDRIAFWLARSSAFQLGLSTYNSAHGVAVLLRSPTVFALSRAFSLVAEQTCTFASFSANCIRLEARRRPEAGGRVSVDSQLPRPHIQLSVFGVEGIHADAFDRQTLCAPEDAARTAMELLGDASRRLPAIRINIRNAPRVSPRRIVRRSPSPSADPP
jgi:hypothetical protein